METAVEIMEKETENNKIAVFFPGIGYNPSMPLLYYGRDIALEAGYKECRQVLYTAPGEPSLRGKFKPDQMEEAFHTLYGRAKENLSDIDWSAYDDILFISKSIGTVIAVAYAAEMGLNGKKIRHVLYTPIEQTFGFEIKDAIAFIGTNDKYSDTPVIIKLADRFKIPLYVYEGTNHSLEIGEISHDLKTLSDVMVRTREFVNPDMEGKTGKACGDNGPAKRNEPARMFWGKCDDKDVKLDPADILYIESVDDKVFAYTPENVVRIDRTLSSFVIEVSDEAFFRCSKSMVLNVNRVTSLKSLSSNRIDATMEGGEHIIISRRYASEFRRLLKGDR